MQAKSHENKVRRAARRQGLSLVKSKRRDRQALDFERFMLIDAMTNCIVLGEPIPGSMGGSADLDDVEQYLRGGRE